MFEHALQANLPVIGVHTDDPANFEQVVQSVAGVKPVKLPSKWTATTLISTLYWTDKTEDVTVELYRHLLNSSKQLLVMNPDRNLLVFDAGELTVPVSMVKETLGQIIQPEMHSEILPAIRGLSLKSIGELVALTQARTGSVSQKELRRTRFMVMGAVQGLAPVETEYDFYVWPVKLKEWITLNKPYFLGNYHNKLVPRGVLLEGSPGVGKSMASKVIANEFGVPLYRLDIASALGKYVGESEARLSRLLVVVEKESPCVLLIDEVEKIFTEKEDGGVTSRILSQLLWWLAEHRSKVFTVMTTNNVKTIPPELFRAGRVDMTMKIPQLSIDEAKGFSKRVFESVLSRLPTHKESLEVASHLKQTGKDEFSHAEVSEIVCMCIKEMKLAHQYS